MELLAAIESRSSAARLGLPAPTPEHLARILDAAAHAPDHGRLRPWRFIVVDAGLRDRFALAAASAKRVRLPSMSEEQFTAECEKM
jgi:nitroreductase